MKTDLDIIAEQCAEIDRRNGDAPLPPADAWLAAAFDLVSAARRVRSKFGTDDTGTPLDWTEWRAVDKACNAIDRIAANAERVRGGGTPYPARSVGQEVRP